MRRDGGDFRDSSGEDLAGDDRDAFAALAAAEGLGVVPESVDRALVEEYELAAGALFMAMVSGRARSGAPMPGDLTERLEVTTSPRAFADHGFRGRMAKSTPSLAARRIQPGPEGQERDPSGEVSPTGSSQLARASTPTPPRHGRGTGSGWIPWTGWVVAAALALAVALGGLGRTGASDAANSDPVQETAQLDPSDVADAFALEPGTVRAPWSVGELTGEVLWSDAKNTGYMRIDGLPANVPTESQYQLWIFRGKDPAQEPYPVDGGVFDVVGDGPVVVPIDAKLGVGAAGLFAVTVERPGGVVVSERDAIVAVAVRS